MSLTPTKVFTRIGYFSISFLFFLFLLTSDVIAQSKLGVLTGKIYDGGTKIGLTGVKIVIDSSRDSIITLAGGTYHLSLTEGIHNISLQYPGYQTKKLGLIHVKHVQESILNIMMFPVSESEKLMPGNTFFLDSAIRQNVDSMISLKGELANPLYNPLLRSHSIFDKIGEEDIQAGTDRDAVSVMSRLHQVSMIPDFSNQNNYSLVIGGMGERYNQLMLNGVGMTSTSKTSQAFPLELMPAEALASVTVFSPATAAVPSNFAGGMVELRTKDMPDKDFFSIQLGAGFSSNTLNKDFLGDRRNSYQVTSFPGSIRNLPDGFPTTSSRTAYSQKNIQEQVELSRTLNNNLAPVDYGKSLPYDRILVGFGKIYKLKKGLTIGVTGYVNHLKNETIEETKIQVLPNVISNPFPFDDLSQKVVNAQSQDLNFKYSAQLGAVLNASFLWRNNKISFRNYLGNQLFSRLSVRDSIIKPDESNIANNALRYATEQTKFVYTQAAGEHSFGEKNNFQIDWQATYNFMDQQNPDERNILLERNETQTDLYRIAEPLSPPFNPIRNVGEATFAPNFTNSSRSWRSSRENAFTGSINLKLPFNLLNRLHILQGGLYMQNITRDFLSDLLLVKGGDYTTIDNLLAPSRYYPGGVSVTNYFSNVDRLSNEPVSQIKLGNYFSSSNVAASYIQLENGILKNLRIQWGFRLESSNVASAIVQYEYAPGFRFPRRFSTQTNSRQVSYKLLPSVNLLYSPFKSIQLTGSYSRSINRPLMQELTSYNYYDAGEFLVQSGNPFLGEAVVNNFSVGTRYVPGSGTHIGIGAFYKNIDQPIENVVFPYSTGNMTSMPFNMPKATVQGLQADLKFQLSRITDSRWLSGISMFASGNIVKSEVEAGPIRNPVIKSIESHELSGTPDYTINAGIILKSFSLPELSVIYNATGDYISRVGFGELINLSNGESTKANPDYRVKGLRSLNVQIAQYLLKSKIQLIAGVNNILDNPIVIYQDLNGNEKFDTPLNVSSDVTNPGLFRNGIDNTVTYIRSQQKFYFRLSYQF